MILVGDQNFITVMSYILTESNLIQAFFVQDKHLKRGLVDVFSYTINSKVYGGGICLENMNFIELMWNFIETLLKNGKVMFVNILKVDVIQH